ncbi:hypothetical protein LTR86_010232 [Recurvomyces mirabilis]|nr:hypothetical protein LTR86_010232 [Recurvomyces mirabilis]
MPTRNEIIAFIAFYGLIVYALLSSLSSLALYLIRTYGPAVLAIYRWLKPYLIGILQSGLIITLPVALYQILERAWWVWKTNELFGQLDALVIAVIHVYALAGMVGTFNRSVPNVGRSAPVRVLVWIWEIVEVWVFEPVGLRILAVWRSCHLIILALVERAKSGDKTSLTPVDTTPETDNTGCSTVLVEGAQDAAPELFDASASPTDHSNGDRVLETEPNAWATTAEDHNSDEADDKLRSAKGRSIASAAFITPGLKSPKPHDGGLATPSPSPAGRSR